MVSAARSIAAALVGAGVAALGARATRRLIDQRSCASEEAAARWHRSNFAGEQVSLTEGPALAAGLVVGQLASGAVTGNRLPIATAANTAIAGALGLIDDLAEADPNAAKGLRGHLGALRRGTLTTGAAKLIGISLSSAATAAIIARARRRTRGSAAAAIVVDTVLIAGMTNLVNLFDLRPGRALKVGALLALPLGAEAFPLAGAGGAVASEDLRGGSMAGDAGANALGAAIGCTWAMAMPLPVRAAAAVGVTALTVASERISFSRVIAGTPILDRIDRLGTARVAPIASHD